MKEIIKAFLVAFFGMFILGLVSTLLSECRAEFIELDKLSVEYRDYFDGGSDPLITNNGIPNRTLGKGLDFNLDTNIFSVLYWNNKVHSMTDEIVNSGGKGQFRAIGWKFDLGVRATPYLNIYYRHHSQHLLDASLPYHFPVNDSVGIELIIFSKNKKESILPW